ncbi:hypothetical protein AB1N83_006302 [Pleurotus pulmonarius]
MHATPLQTFAYALPPSSQHDGDRVCGRNREVAKAVIGCFRLKVMNPNGNCYNLLQRRYPSIIPGSRISAISSNLR